MAWLHTKGGHSTLQAKGLQVSRCAIAQVRARAHQKFGGLVCSFAWGRCQKRSVPKGTRGIDRGVRRRHVCKAGGAETSQASIRRRRADQSKWVGWGGLKEASPRGWPNRPWEEQGLAYHHVLGAAARRLRSGGGISGSRRGAECLHPMWQVQREHTEESEGERERARGEGAGMR